MKPSLFSINKHPHLCEFSRFWSKSPSNCVINVLKQIKWGFIHTWNKDDNIQIGRRIDLWLVTAFINRRTIRVVWKHTGTTSKFGWGHLFLLLMSALWYDFQLKTTCWWRCLYQGRTSHYTLFCEQVFVINLARADCSLLMDQCFIFWEILR